ncbi:MAG: hypothetical protein ACFCVD_15195 [Nodosilinea sp.]
MDDPSPRAILKSDVIGRLGLNLDTAEELGTLTEIWVNSRTHQVTGIGCGGGLGRQSRRFLWSQVASIGRDGVVLKAAIAAAEVEHQLQDGLPLADLELWSDHGDRVGQLVDYRFDRSTGNILQYLFIANPVSGLAPGRYALEPVAIISTGRRRMMADAEAISLATLVEAGVEPGPVPPQPRTPFNRVPLDQIPDPRQGWETAVEGTRQVREQVGEQLQEHRQKLRSEAQDRLGNLLGNVKKRTRRLRNQLRETVTDVTAGLPSGTQLQDDTMPTIDVDAMELWPEEEERPL